MQELTNREQIFLSLMRWWGAQSVSEAYFKQVILRIVRNQVNLLQ